MKAFLILVVLAIVAMVGLRAGLTLGRRGRILRPRDGKEPR